MKIASKVSLAKAVLFAGGVLLCSTSASGQESSKFEYKGMSLGGEIPYELFHGGSVKKVSVTRKQDQKIFEFGYSAPSNLLMLREGGGGLTAQTTLDGLDVALIGDLEGRIVAFQTRYSLPRTAEQVQSQTYFDLDELKSMVIKQVGFEPRITGTFSPGYKQTGEFLLFANSEMCASEFKSVVTEEYYKGQISLNTDKLSRYMNLASIVVPLNWQIRQGERTGRYDRYPPAFPNCGETILVMLDKRGMFNIHAIDFANLYSLYNDFYSGFNDYTPPEALKVDPF